MKRLHGLLNRITGSSAGGRTCFMVIQPDAVYLSASAKSASPARFDISDGNWDKSCEQALSVAASTYDSLTVVLSHNFYQIYQIDKPSMPRQEWPSALPFLLKELISERAIDIVADAVELPNSTKVQTYVLPRKTLDKLMLLSERYQLPLNTIVPEDEVWGRASGELGNFLLLQRSCKGHFRISAFVEHIMMFNRTIRSVTSPLTGVPSTDLQMDSLSLELQRSIDYLSSQVRNVQLHQLKVCCDEEDENELSQSLNYRISTKVSALAGEAHELSGHVLANTASQVSEWRVNLFPSYLKPKKRLLTLKNVAISWVTAALVIMLSYGYVSWQNQGVDDQINIAKSKGDILKSELERYNAQLRKLKPDANKLAAQARLEREVQAKRDSLTAVGKYDDSQRIGYSGIMTSLAKLSNNNISISGIHIAQEQLDIKGLARTPRAVPDWVGQFKSEISLVGRTFDDVAIGRNDKGMVTFELSTRKEAQE